ncbi:RNase H-like domain found in reverse transcriptase [Popillia japonica]|uniref:RNase H-like domain found in reverse transcriptase n=1 Tax=Popillia japonica TaxID=7064 RepID=A0AAW1LXF0_POPJA
MGEEAEEILIQFKCQPETYAKALQSQSKLTLEEAILAARQAEIQISQSQILRQETRQGAVYQQKINLISDDHLRKKLTPGKPRKVGPPGDRTGERNLKGNPAEERSPPGDRTGERNLKGNPAEERSGSCQFCELRSHTRQRCPAKESTCRTCSKTGHWSKVCRSKKKQPVEPARKQDIGVRFIHGLGSILMQIGANQTKEVVAFASRLLSPTEMRYAQIEKEALALTWAAEKFSEYVTGIPKIIFETDHKPEKFSEYVTGIPKIIFETDHKPLIQVLQSRPIDSLSPRLQRFRMRLMRYNYEIKYIPGKDLIPADALSRSPINQSVPHDYELSSEVEAHVYSIIGNLPIKDSYLQEIIKQQDATRSFRFHTLRTSRTCPNCVEERVNHKEPFYKEKTPDRPCVEERVNHKEPFYKEKTPDRPWQKIGIDLFKFKDWYLIVTDYFSKYFEIFKLRSLNENEI